MLDKSIPYFNVIMKRAKETAFLLSAPAEGFSFTTYKDGDEKYWAEIEKSVGEFENVQDGLKYFEQTYLPFADEISKRVIFLNTTDNEKIGTITAWWNYTGTRRDSSIHWVAIKPAFQGKGLGRTLVNYGVKTIFELDGECDVYVHTQTWSYRAIAVYLKEDFEIMQDETFGRYRNDFNDALPFLQKKISGFRAV